MTRKEAVSLLGCSNTMFYRLVYSGRIRYKKLAKNKYDYNIDDVYQVIGKKLVKDTMTAVYCRVAGTTDVDRAVMQSQRQKIVNWCLNRGLKIDVVYEDWVPSTEFSISKRPGLHAMLRDIIKKRIGFVVVETPDRLARVGWELFPSLFKYYGVEVLVLNDKISLPEYADEQVRDLERILIAAGANSIDDLSGPRLPYPKRDITRGKPEKFEALAWEEELDPELYEEEVDPEEEHLARQKQFKRNKYLERVGRRDEIIDPDGTTESDTGTTESNLSDLI